MKIVKKAIKAFAMFWWNFLVGDTPELFVAVLAILAVLALFKSNHSHALMIVLPVLVLGALTASVWRAARKR
jgi:hypothetical protein